MSLLLILAVIQHSRRWAPCDCDGIVNDCSVPEAVVVTGVCSTPSSLKWIVFDTDPYGVYVKFTDEPTGYVYLSLNPDSRRMSATCTVHDFMLTEPPSSVIVSVNF